MLHTCCFTGHRPQDLLFLQDKSDYRYRLLLSRLEGEILKLYIEQDVRTFISGMALGIDQIAAETVLKLKRNFTDIKLIAALPCLGQEAKWKDSERIHYQELLSKADRTHIVGESYSPVCMMDRNRFMVDNSRYVIAVWDGRPTGGTAITVKYAEQRQKHLVIIDPRNLNDCFT